MIGLTTRHAVCKPYADLDLSVHQYSDQGLFNSLMYYTRRCKLATLIGYALSISHDYIESLQLHTLIYQSHVDHCISISAGPFSIQRESSSVYLYNLFYRNNNFM